MERSTRVLLTVVIMALGAAVLLALTVYPFQYGLGESLILVGALVGALLFQTVLDDTSF
ncbi:MAG: hypothetical protein U9O06_04235 [Euryarchaeota archaeon]|nr:hypothetical protein [Euryarchaeota archaeon]